MAGADLLQDGLEGVQDMLEGTDVEELLEGREQIMCMQAISPEGPNVNVLYTKMSTVERVANLAISEEEALDSILQQIETLKESYSAMGITVDSMEKKTVTYAGEERMGILTTGTVQGVTCYIFQIYERALGAYSAVITMTAYQEDTTANIAETANTFLFHPMYFVPRYLLIVSIIIMT